MNEIINMYLIRKKRKRKRKNKHDRISTFNIMEITQVL